MRKNIFLSLLSSLLLILSFPNFNLEFLAWFGFVPLFFALQDKSKFKAFFLSYFTGIIFWSGTIYWLIHVTLPGMLLLVLYLALYFGIFGLLLSMSYLLPTTYYLLFIPSVWILLEYIRAHLFTGFGWAILGYSQYLNLPVIQIADITGAWGVSFLVMTVNMFIWQLIFCARRHMPHARRILFSSFFFIFLFLLVLGYGYHKLYVQRATWSAQPIKISVIQGNVPQELKWNPESKDFIIAKYLTLASQAAQDNPDLIIWPEAAIPAVLEEEPLYYERASAFAKEAKMPLLFGVLTLRNDFYYNSALLVSKQGELLAGYDKLHLVPFGEYIPLRKIFGFLETVVPIGDFTKGKEYIIFKLPVTSYQLPVNYSVLICFEDLFPELSREFIKKGADFLVNITNDAWFKRTSSPYQHLQASVFRAVENRRPLIRAANTGVSGFIAADGKILSLVQDETGRNIFVDGYKSQKILMPQRKGLSFYTRYGDVFVGLCFIFVLGIMLKLKSLKPLD